MRKKNFDETKLMYGLSVAVFLCGLGLLSWFVWQYFSNPSFSIVEFVEEKIREPEKCDFRRVLDGRCVDSIEKINQKLTAVMIENHPAARPPFGLARASVVYEAPVEANYTRFLAIYLAEENIAKIGPVRSARSYYLDWLAEYGEPMYMHCGGSPEALQKIASIGVFDINEMQRGQYFWRDMDRLAPHNLFTSSELWSKVFADQNKLQDTSYMPQEGWRFGDSGQLIVDSAVTSTNNVIVSFLAPVYVVDWKYNSSTQKYERWQAGTEHRDADGTLIVADTVIVQHVKTKVLDEIGRLDMTTIGSGLVEVYYGGKEIFGTWKKPDRTSRTRFYDKFGEEIKLKSGKIWVEVVNR